MDTNHESCLLGPIFPISASISPELKLMLRIRCSTKVHFRSTANPAQTKLVNNNLIKLLKFLSISVISSSLEMEFLDINLMKQSSLLLNAIRHPQSLVLADFKENHTLWGQKNQTKTRVWEDSSLCPENLTKMPFKNSISIYCPVM